MKKPIETSNYKERMKRKLYGDLPEIVVYTTPTCPKCKELKAHFERLNITYTEINITDTDAMCDLVMENTVILSVPTLRIGNTFFTVREGTPK